MKYINFKGDTVSKLSLGTVQFGLDYGVSNIRGRPSQNEAKNIVSYLIKEGVTCFDTAMAYGESEKVLGVALGNQNSARIVSKISSLDFLESLESRISCSLRDLRVKQLFGLLLHDTQLLTTWSEKNDEDVCRLQQKGLIKHFGVSIYTEKEFDLAIVNDAIELIQVPFNLFDQRAVKSAWFERAREENKMIFIRSIFLQGLFFMDTAKLTGSLKQAIGFIEKAKEIQKTTGFTMAELAMSYVEAKAPDAVILFGCDNLRQAKDNVQLYKRLPLLERDVLDAIELAFHNVPSCIINPSLWRG